MCFFLGRGEMRAPLKSLRGRLDIQWNKIFSSQVFSCNNFFPSKSVCRILFSEIKHPPPPPRLKSQMVGPFQSCFRLLLRRHYSRFREQTTPVFADHRHQYLIFFFIYFDHALPKKLCMPMVAEIDRLCSLGTATALINNVTENTWQQSKRGSCVWQVSHEEEERTTKKSRGK